MRRLLLLALPAFGLAGVVGVIAVLVPAFLAVQHFPTDPTQPLYFDHRVHVEQAGLDCAFCHRTANEGVAAGMPPVEQCMFCHQVVAQGQNEADIATLRQAWLDQRPVDWARIHLVPDHSRFPHEAHVQAGVPCSTCHGDVGQMGQVRQVRSLKMGDCVACHQESSATVQCGACHY
jgi:hypothetical protein